MSHELKDTRVDFVMSKSELDRLDAWRKEQNMWSRAAAIRHLIAQGLDREDRRKAERKRKAAIRAARPSAKTRRKNK